MRYKRGKGFAIVLFLIAILLYNSCTKHHDGTFFSDLPASVERIWIGPEYWTNPMQDWMLRDGKIVCTVQGRDRNVHLLTRTIDEQTGNFKISINAGILQKTNNDADWIGFKIGAKGEFDDFRSDAVFGQGFNLGVTTSGGMFIGNIEEVNKEESLDIKDVFSNFVISVIGIKEGETYHLKFQVYDDDLVGVLETEVEANKLHGNIAIVSHFDPGKEGTNATILENGAWFRNWRIEADHVGVHDDRAFGPLLFAQHTLSDRILKMTVQLPPIGDQDGDEVILEINEGKNWQKVAASSIDANSRTATLKVENWNDAISHPYRVTYQYIGKDDEVITDTFTGTIRKNPVDKEEIVVAGFTGNNDLGFPNQELVANVLGQQPDVLFFSGDQIYEPVGGYGNIHTPLDKAMVDYLRKWIMYGWEYREMLRNIPTVSIPDDHDVYHGNLWGEGGKKAKETGSEKERQDSGGYKLPADFVNMVERTQTSNLPDPYDPAPVKQGIGVYYTEMNYGGLSFAIIEDRKFKSSPANVLPKEARAINGWAENKDFDVRNQSDAPGAVLLGDRQEKFLKEWGSNWSNETFMKVMLSQTIFNNVATLPEEAVSDVVVSTLRIMEKGDYPPNDAIVSDMDSNGWPHTARNKAVDLLRRCFAFHLAGDQHLGSTIHYGVDDWKDASVAACVPSVSNYFPRRWYPNIEGKNRSEGALKNLGDFMDGFNNYVTVYAVANPLFTGKKPSRLYDRAAGYGIVKFNKTTRDIIVELWPRDGDPNDPNSAPYDGWPVIVNQLDNFGKEPFGYLPKIVVEGLEQPPVIQVIDEKGEVVYTIRAINNEFKPMVFADGTYQVIIGEPGLDKIQIVEDVQPAIDQQDQLVLKF